MPKPTPEHERLARDVGTWDATIKSWMQGPGSEPSVPKGVEVAKMMPGGLWVLSEFHGKFGDAAFHGQGQTGYDPVKKKYIGTWVRPAAINQLVTAPHLKWLAFGHRDRSLRRPRARTRALPGSPDRARGRVRPGDRIEAG